MTDFLSRQDAETAKTYLRTEFIHVKSAFRSLQILLNSDPHFPTRQSLV